MSLHNQIKEEMKAAMRARDTVKTTVMRGILAAFTNELLAKKSSSEEIDDQDGLMIIKRLVKQRKDSIEQFSKGGRQDLVAQEQVELNILQTLLPPSVPREKILEVAKSKKTQLGVTDKVGMGKLIGAVSKEFKGQADGADIKSVVESLF